MSETVGCASSSTGTQKTRPTTSTSVCTADTAKAEILEDFWRGGRDSISPRCAGAAPSQGLGESALREQDLLATATCEELSVGLSQ